MQTVQFHDFSKQSGAVLAISLIMLTAITFVAVLGMQRSGIQSKIVSNIKIKAITFNESKSTNEGAFEHYRKESTKNLSLVMNKKTNNAGERIMPNNLTRDIAAGFEVSSSIAHLPTFGTQSGLFPKTSALRDTFSRGTSGGTERFRLNAIASLKGASRDDQGMPIGITSNQTVGMTFILPN